jgi:hypothetical protein
MSTAEVASTYNDVIRRIVSSCQKLLSNRKVKVSDRSSSYSLLGRLIRHSRSTHPPIPMFIYLNNDWFLAISTL